jgi:uncharacterized protein (TIGR02677 family)
LNPIMTPAGLRSVPELSYLTAANVARYRAVMKFMYMEYQRLNYWLRPEEIYAGVQAWGVLDGYTLEQCLSDLESLKGWGNLASRHDGGRALSVEEYMRKKSQYLLTPYAIEIERMLESLEKVKGYGGSLETTFFDTIAACIQEIRARSMDFEPGEALRNWEKLYEAFKTMHENAADFIASIHSIQAEEMMATEGFLALKDNLVIYLQHFVKGLQRSAYRIEGQLQRIGDGLRDAYLEKVLEDELIKPRLEEGKTRDELWLEFQQGWNNLKRWFVGDDNALSELTLLERATKEAIAKVVRSAVRLQERRRGGVSRRNDLEALGRRFAIMEDLDEAHKLAAYAFGLFPTRHLQGQDERHTERADASTWDEPPNVRLVRTRSRKRSSRSAQEPIRAQDAKREAYREQLLLQREEERAFVEKMRGFGQVRIAGLPRLKAHERIRLLQWIGRCTASTSRAFVTADGFRISLTIPEEEEEAVLRSEDGDLMMLIADDDLSSQVMVYLRQVELLSLDRLSRVRYDRIFMVENPSIFAELMDADSRERDESNTRASPVIVCGNGRPTTAVIRLLDTLLSCRENVRLHYGGDLDPAGLGIAQSLQFRYKKAFRAWRMDKEQYLQYAHRGIPLTEDERSKMQECRYEWDAALAEVMADKGVKLHQELWVADLLRDVGKMP